MEEQLQDLPADANVARVTAVDRESFVVRQGSIEARAELAGRFRLEVRAPEDLPCVGDWVRIRHPPAAGPEIIYEVLPRKSWLRRKTPGKSMEHQYIAANIDVAFIVQGCDFDFNLRRLDRYLVMAEDGKIAPQIILTKTDLVSQEELDAMLRQIQDAGIRAPVLSISNASGTGVEEFRNQLKPGCTYCLLGSSGVGKSTLINRLAESVSLETRPVSESGEGVHTTTRRQLLLLENGAMIIDTPGMRELGIVACDESIDRTFDEFGTHADGCRFPDCTHTHEPGCAVRAALERGELQEDRYQSYLKLKKEADFHSLSKVEKRRKERVFGRLVKSVTKMKRDQT